MESFVSKLSLNWKSEDDYTASVEVLEKATGILLRNIISVTAITALVNGNTKIEPKHTVGALEYIHRKCPMPSYVAEPVRGQSGGTSLPATFFGGNESMYSAMNPSGGSAETIQFGLGIARAEISQTGGAQPKASKTSSVLDKWINGEIKNYLEHHRVTVSKMAKAQLVRLAKQYLACLFYDLSKNTPISIRKVREMLKKKKYAIFH